MYMCVCVHVCLYRYDVLGVVAGASTVYMYVCVYACMCMQVCMYIMRRHTKILLVLGQVLARCMCIRTHAHSGTYIYIHVHTYIEVDITAALLSDAYIHTDINTDIHTKQT